MATPPERAAPCPSRAQRALAPREQATAPGGPSRLDKAAPVFAGHPARGGPSPTCTEAICARICEALPRRSARLRGTGEQGRLRAGAGCAVFLAGTADFRAAAEPPFWAPHA